MARKKPEMTEQDKAFMQRVRSVASQMGGINKLAQAAKISSPTIRGWVSRPIRPTYDLLLKISKAAGISLIWLITGEGGMKDPSGVVHDDMYYFFKCGKYDDKGEFVEGFKVQFSRAYIDQHVDSHPSKLFMIECLTMEMEPTFVRGDFLLLAEVEGFPSDGVYVIKQDGAIAIRRLSRLPKSKIAVKAANKDFESFEVHRDEIGKSIKVEARVMMKTEHKLI